MEPGAAGAVGTRLASTLLVPLVKRLFVQDEPGAGLVAEPVRISALVSFRGEQRALGEAQLGKLTTELVRRACRDVPPAERPVPEDEERAVAFALTRTLLALGDVGMEDVQAVRLGHREFARVLRAGAPRAERGLSADATRLYGSLLDTACLHVLHFFTRRSTFVARSLVEQSRELDGLVRTLDVLVARVPAQDAADVRFERRYADFLVGKHGTLTIHGLDLRQRREWPLDTAYLTLEATERTPQPPAGPPAGNGAPPGVAPHTTTLPADRVLVDHERVLLRGDAGSGKTTLVQWLAVSTARQDAAPGTAHLLGRVPFVLPLRTLTRGGARLPVPADFLAATSCPVAGAQPPGWAERVLDAGRALLLVDGVDEVPAEERDRTRRWLRDLVTAFPGNLWLVTSRPSAVTDDWLDAAGFAELSLAPMSRTDVAAFVHRWHHAAGAEPALGEALLTAVRGQQDLARLAVNPLMCGLICALHRERRGFLPRGRKALYDAALSMLLERRDRERGDIHHPDGADLDEESQVELLQKLAYWLIRNGRAELDRSDAVELLARVLPAMPQVAARGSAADVLQHLLVRSGVLREPAPDTVDFVHRTFQDYLGAREAVEERDIDLLVRHAHLDQWEDVLRMAVAHARPDERARLLGTLVERGDREPDHRTRLHVLAAACLEHATKLDPAVRAGVERRTAALVPPRGLDEAKALARIGPAVLELLPGPGELTVAEAVDVVHTAAQVGGDAALPVLLRFRDHAYDGVARQLGGHWDRFDTETYAREVLAHLTDRPNAFLTARSNEELDRLRALGGAVSVAVHGEFTPDRIASALDPDALAELRLAKNPLLTDLGFLSAYSSLHSLDLADCPAVTDLSPLEDTHVTHLTLRDMAGLRDLRGAAALTRLRYLGLSRDVHWPGAAALPRTAPLSHLQLPRHGSELEGLELLPSLTYLGLWDLTVPPRVSDWAAVAAHPGLRELALRPTDVLDLAAARLPMPRLSRLYLLVDDEECDLAAVTALFPGLVHVALNRAGYADLAPLVELDSLESVFVSARQVENAHRLPPYVDLTHLTVR
ncbi:NACHT domain-containing protein [Streptomyces sp. Z26]|uniref:NACHT domain-containing protein n=1 Tax=Streptomyces sp. Z26 TaxID=2500177 RepID=UPI000EF154D7|nr:NACHT domain-containing protein [Streptomyces sp. Z26]RLL68279.1 NACHT domain-containing protein [Streptomyces sp. Z26]